MNDDKVKKILIEVSKEKGIPVDVLERAYRHQFKVVREHVSQCREIEEYPIIYLRHLGKFIPRPFYIERSNEFRKEKNKRDNGGLAELVDPESDS
jgi:hypothetical protein